jgi:Ca2+-binding EF-hand superfamily protein
MSISWSRLACALAMSILLPAKLAAAAPVAGQTQAGCRCAPAAPGFLLQQIQVGLTEENFVAMVMLPFRAADRASDGLDAGDVDFVRKRAAARERAQRIQSVLQYDLDGDMRVTRAEIDAATAHPGQTPFGNTTADALMNRYDLNRDGVIELREIAAAPALTTRDDFQTAYLEQLLSLSGGKPLSAAALQEIARRAFASVDTDHNGRISQAEYEAFRSAR